MMGQQKSERELFNYAIKLEKRVRSNHYRGGDNLNPSAAGSNWTLTVEYVPLPYRSRRQDSRDGV
jgi:hypothetical protein